MNGLQANGGSFVGIINQLLEILDKMHQDRYFGQFLCHANQFLSIVEIRRLTIGSLAVQLIVIAFDDILDGNECVLGLADRGFKLRMYAELGTLP